MLNCYIYTIFVPLSTPGASIIGGNVGGLIRKKSYHIMTKTSFTTFENEIFHPGIVIVGFLGENINYLLMRGGDFVLLLLWSYVDR